MAEEKSSLLREGERELERERERERERDLTLRDLTRMALTLGERERRTLLAERDRDRRTLRERRTLLAERERDRDRDFLVILLVGIYCTKK